MAKLAGNDSAALDDGRPVRDEGRRDAAFVSEMFVKQERRVADVCPRQAVALPDVVRPGEGGMIAVAHSDFPAVAGLAGNIIPARLDDFGAGAIVREKNHQRVCFNALFL